jgi:hypothetical protein
MVSCVTERNLTTRSSGLSCRRSLIRVPSSALFSLSLLSLSLSRARISREAGRRYEVTRSRCSVACREDWQSCRPRRSCAAGYPNSTKRPTQLDTVDEIAAALGVKPISQRRTNCGRRRSLSPRLRANSASQSGRGGSWPGRARGATQIRVQAYVAAPHIARGRSPICAPGPPAGLERADGQRRSRRPRRPVVRELAGA